MNRKKYALFDLDGTIFDSSVGIKSCYREALSHFGITVQDDSELDKVMGPSLYLSFHEFFGLEGEQVNEAVKIYRDRYNAEGIYQVKMYDGIDEAIKQLKRERCVICLATTKPQVMAEKILDFAGLARWFDIVCGAHLDGSRSDKAELIEAVLRQSKYPVEKRDVYMIGDRLYDMEGAVKAHVRALGVTYGFGSREELMAAGAQYLADTPQEIVEIISGQRFYDSERLR